MLEKSKGLVLQSLEFMESSYICTILTERRGLIKVIAKGARRPKSPLRNLCNMFGTINIVYYFKRDRELQILKEGNIVRRRGGIASSYDKYLLCSEIVSFVLQFLPYEGGKEIFYLVESVLDFIETSIEINPLIFNVFVFKVLKKEGTFPELDKCVICENKETQFFSWSKGGVICKACLKNKLDAIKITQGVKKELLYLLEADWHDITRLKIGKITESILKSIPYLKGK